jgi:hypothetical protein
MPSVILYIKISIIFGIQLFSSFCKIFDLAPVFMYQLSFVMYFLLKERMGNPFATHAKYDQKYLRNALHISVTQWLLLKNLQKILTTVPSVGRSWKLPENCRVLIYSTSM